MVDEGETRSGTGGVSRASMREDMFAVAAVPILGVVCIGAWRGR